MSLHPTPTDTPTCPTCSAALKREGDLLRCEQHGLFFRYGPRLLVHVAHGEEHEAALMPWQTLVEDKPETGNRRPEP